MFFSLEFDSLLLCLIFTTEPSTWCATGRHVSVLPWRRSTSRIWSWGIRSSRLLWRGTSSPSQRTRLWSPCSARLKHGDICAWSWNMSRVRDSVIFVSCALFVLSLPSSDSFFLGCSASHLYLLFTDRALMKYFSTTKQITTHFVLLKSFFWV